MYVNRCFINENPLSFGIGTAWMNLPSFFFCFLREYKIINGIISNWAFWHRMAAAFRAAAIHQAKRVGFTQQALEIAAKETTLRLVVLNYFLIIRLWRIKMGQISNVFFWLFLPFQWTSSSRGSFWLFMSIGFDQLHKQFLVARSSKTGTFLTNR